MCGFAGYVDLWERQRVDQSIIEKMTEKLFHRGPDSSGYFVEANIGLGIRRLRIIDLETGDQPLYNEDGNVVLVCNGEIFTYRELQRELAERGHLFRTKTDVEVLIHLYEEYGLNLLDRLNGQFAFALYDRTRRQLLLARDHFGISPLYFTIVDGFLIFASEIKSILAHPAVTRQVDLIGLDQILSMPGLISPRTMFQGINSLPSGHFIKTTDGQVEVKEYWDLDYPQVGREDSMLRDEVYYVEGLLELFTRSVERRLLSDVPVGLLVSGGLDSALVAAVVSQLTPDIIRYSFSVSFEDREINEAPFQHLVASSLGCRHHEVCIDIPSIAERLHDMVYHCECPVKESFNTCSLALAQTIKSSGVTVVLAGEGSDELFGGYPSYRFDAAGSRNNDSGLSEVEIALEEELREELWGEPSFFYEKNQVTFREIKQALYSRQINERFSTVDSLRHPLVNKSRLKNRHPLHQRSYLDFKLRLSDHLLSEHGDRMVMAHSVEARYPFLDIDLVNFARQMPPSLKVNGLTDKYVVRKMARGLVLRQVAEREKFGFRAPGSPALLQHGIEWVDDLLSFERIRRQGYFNPSVVERLKKQYSQLGFKLHPHLETDLLILVLTFNLLTDLFELPDLA